MKKQRYIVEIEMPDGDFISAGWLKDLIQTDCDVEDESRKKVTVQETSISSNLDEAAEKYSQTRNPYGKKAFKAGAEWMAGQGVTKEVVIGMTTEEISINVSQQTLDKLDLCPGDKVIVQIRKAK